jgi:hypothetical protein
MSLPPKHLLKHVLPERVLISFYLYMYSFHRQSGSSSRCVAPSQAQLLGTLQCACATLRADGNFVFCRFNSAKLDLFAFDVLIETIEQFQRISVLQSLFFVACMGI